MGWEPRGPCVAQRPPHTGMPRNALADTPRTSEQTSGRRPAPRPVWPRWHLNQPPKLAPWGVRPLRTGSDWLPPPTAVRPRFRHAFSRWAARSFWGDPCPSVCVGCGSPAAAGSVFSFRVRGCGWSCWQHLCRAPCQRDLSLACVSAGAPDGRSPVSSRLVPREAAD